MKELIDFGALTIIYFLIFYKKWKSKGKDVLFINTAMYIYLSIILCLTLMPVLTSLPYVFNHPYRPMNLVPFIDVLNGRGDFARQIVLNIFMTVPFGFLLPLRNKENARLSKVIFYTFLLSIAIELLQPLIDGFRASDITDIITNVTGGIIGYAIYLMSRPLTVKIFNYIKNK